MSKLFVFVALAGSATAAVAGPTLVSQPVTTVLQSFEAIPSDDAPGIVARVYDNWTNPGAALTGIFTSGSNEIADDLGMTGGGLLTNMGINVANSNAPSNLTGGAVAVRFYDGGGVFISGFNANLPALALAAGGSTRLQFGANALNSLNIILPANCFVSLQYTTATFSGTGSIANLGFQTRGPINVGTSTDNMINVTTSGNINFGGAPLANGGIFIDADTAIPAPAGLALLGFSGVVATRRRR